MSVERSLPADHRADLRTAIENLYFIYAERIDAGDLAGVAELFARARFVGPDGAPIATGQAEIQRLYERSTRLYEDGTPKTQHVTTNVILDLDDDGRGVSSRARFTVFQALPDFPLQPIITGHYRDRFAWDGDSGWHFVERAIQPVLLGDLSRHLLHAIDVS